jgi:PTH1 family peptidyl-tRNA hydrolase
MVFSPSSPSSLNLTDFGGRIDFMKLIIGIGNPGKKYENNRHNAGFFVIDRLVEEFRVRGYGLQQEWKRSTKGKLQYIWFDVDGEKIEFIKPQIFMNDSGFSVAYAYKNHPELEYEDIYIIHDDLDLSLGSYKIQKGKGPREHRGLLSIYGLLGNKDFWHVRVGVENRQKRSKVPSGEDYVLQDFTKDELEILVKTINNIVSELLTMLS